MASLCVTEFSMDEVLLFSYMRDIKVENGVKIGELYEILCEYDKKNLMNQY